MAKFEALGLITIHVPVTVDAAPNWSAARTAVHAALEALFDASPISGTDGVIPYTDYRNLRQVEGPWLYNIAWYDLHYPGDVMVIKAPLGGAVSQRHVDILTARLATLGLTVVDAWNVGCERTSLRVQGRRNNQPLTPEQVAALVAHPEADACFVVASPDIDPPPGWVGIARCDETKLFADDEAAARWVGGARTGVVAEYPDGSRIVALLDSVGTLFEVAPEGTEFLFIVPEHDARVKGLL